jgi:hypothetical protein
MLYAKVVEGSFTKGLFHQFIEGLLWRMDQTMVQGSVIVMDNARIHKDPDTIALIEQQYVYLSFGSCVPLTIKI